jgi:hypothetical protein
VLRLNTSSRFLGHGKDIGDFHATRKISGKGKQKIVFTIDQFNGKKDESLSWSAIVNFSISITDLESKQKLDLSCIDEPRYLQRIEMIPSP